MRRPNFQEEKRLWKLGLKRVAGLDEAGRGPLAGPVVAAAVILNSKFKNQNTKLQFRIQRLEIKDSKQLSPKKREKLYKILTKHPAIKWGIGVVSQKVIDEINIKNAAELAMQRAINNLKCKNQDGKFKPDFLISDKGVNLKLAIPCKSVKSADAKVFSCSAASILAKVTRDRLMIKLHKKYPQYRFDLHKGYGTKLHLALLKKHGPCKIHRKTFAPVRNY